MSSCSADTYWALVDADAPSQRLDYDYRRPGLGRIRRFREQRPDTPLGAHLLEKPQYGIAESGSLTGSVPFVNIQHIARSGRIAFANESFLDSASDAHRLMAGDIVVARTGFTLGKAAFVEAEQDGYAYGSFCLRLRLAPYTESDGYLPEFLTAFLNSPLGREQFALLQTGSDKKNVNQEQVADVRLPALPPPAQSRVLEELKPLRDAALLAEHEAESQLSSALDGFETDLGSCERSPRVFAHRSTGGSSSHFWATASGSSPESRLDFEHLSPDNTREISLLGKTRALARLEEVATFITTGNALELDEGSTARGVKAAAVQMGYLDESAMVRVRCPEADACTLQSGDLLIVNIGHGSLGNVALYDGEPGTTVAGPEVTVVRMGEGYDPSFVAFYLMSRFGQSQFCRWFTGSSGQLHLNERQLGAFLLPEPGRAGMTLDQQRSLADTARQRFQAAMQARRDAQTNWDEYYDGFAQRAWSDPR